MAKNENAEYSKALGERIKMLMETAGLELAGVAEFTQISDSHLYSLINGTRNLTGKTAEKLANSFGLEGWMLLNLNYKIPHSIRKSTKLLEFYANFKNVREYFSETLDTRKASSFIEKKLLKSNFLSAPKFIWEINAECSSKGYAYSSKQLSQILTYLVHKGVIKSEKRPIKLRNGEFGKRMVDVFWE
ncbi:MAG: helix-turn-helix transcriptional regulator [Pedobacter agri]